MSSLTRYFCALVWFSLLLPLLSGASSLFAQATTYSYLALGDSYTSGEGIAKADRWSVQMAKLLRESDLPLQDPNVIAKMGWTCQELQKQGIELYDNTKKYDLVSLMIGVNNQYRNQMPDDFRTEFRAMLHTAISFAQSGESQRVIVVSIPDWGVTPLGSQSNPKRIAQQIDVFNAIERAECAAAGATFIDITAVTRTARGNKAMFAADGVNFSAKMHRYWLEHILPTAQKSLVNFAANNTNTSALFVNNSSR